jgi:uncharacterized protein YerC
MSQVSKRTLSKNVEKKMYSIFFNTLARLSNPLDIQDFILDLLGPAEQIMLAKRLAIAVLLVKGYQYGTIKDILKVSQETIARVNMMLTFRGKGYNIAIKRVLRGEKLEDLFKVIGDSAVEILPESSIKRSLRKERKRTRKPKTALG